MSMISKKNRQLAAGLMSALYISAGVAGPFSFTKIADSTNTDFTLGVFALPSLNDNGHVVFHSQESIGGAQQIFLGSGSGITELASAPGLDNILDFRPAINDNFVLIARNSFDGGTSGLFTVDLSSPGLPGPLTPYLTSTTDGVSFINSVTVNSSNQIAAFAETGSGTGIITSSSAGSFNLIAEDQDSGGGIFHFDPVIDDSGNVAFIQAGSGGSGIILSDFAGGPQDVIAQDFSGTFAGGFFETPLDLVDGDVTFRGALGGGLAGIFSSDSDGPISSLVDNLNGFFDITAHVATESGALAFEALPSAGSRGIYTGLDSVADKVVAVGDTVDGKVVTMALLGDANDVGQLSMILGFADGTTGVYRADPDGVGLSQFNPIMPVFPPIGEPERVVIQSLVDHLVNQLLMPGPLDPPELFEGLGGEPENYIYDFLPDIIAAHARYMLFLEAESGRWFDPPATNGFFFETLSDSLFTDILDFPVGFDAEFKVLTDLGIAPGTYGPGNPLNFIDVFGQNVKRFTIFDIQPAVDSEDPQAFPIQLAFTTDVADFAMLSILPPVIPLPNSGVPAPGTLAVFAIGLLCLSLIRRRRVIIPV